MSYKLGEAGTISLKYESEMHAPLLNACCVIYEIELFKLWVPFCKESREVRRVSKGHKVGYI